MQSIPSHRSAPVSCVYSSLLIGVRARQTDKAFECKKNACPEQPLVSVQRVRSPGSWGCSFSRRHRT
jgi:hypothetical protein